MNIDTLDPAARAAREREVTERYEALKAEGISLDLTRGNPSIAQLDLSTGLDDALAGDYRLADGSDSRGYGGLDGTAEAKGLAAAWLRVGLGDVLIGGNSSLSLMYLSMLYANHFGLDGADSAWRNEPNGARFLAPVPGYDRHFKICEEFGIEMLPVPMTGEGPDMDVVEKLVAADPGIKGMWCVPRYSNPSGETYSDDTVRRIAALGATAGKGFRVFWDDAYAVHTLDETPAPLANLMDLVRAAGTEDSVLMFGSTSKVTYAGSGLAFMAASASNLAAMRKHLGVMTIGPDKVNQLRHTRLLPNMAAVHGHMHRHGEILGPKFDCVERHLTDALGNRGMGTWTSPRGGYFVSFNAKPGLATEIVRLAGEAGVKLTPAGAAYPYGRDPDDSHIRLAPSLPPLADVDRAMAVFTTCVELATLRAGAS